MKVLCIISGDLEKASTKFRLIQYLPILESKGIDVEFIARKSLSPDVVDTVKNFDIVFNNRCLFRNGLAKKLIAASRRTVFDFDDAIYTRPGRPHSTITALRVKQRFQLWLREADVITVPNAILAGSAKEISSAVEIIPMALDLDVWQPKVSRSRKTLTIGWIGSPVNLPNIEKIEPVLGKLVKKYPFVRLAVFCGERPELKTSFDYFPYTPGEECNFVQRLDLGLLPLEYEEFTLGKSPIKAVQYLACGIPVVGNIRGATAEILNSSNSIAVDNDEEWAAGLDKLINDHTLRKKMGRAGREFAVENHDLKKTAEQLVRALTGK